MFDGHRLVNVVLALGATSLLGVASGCTDAGSSAFDTSADSIGEAGSGESGDESGGESGDEESGDTSTTGEALVLTIDITDGACVDLAIDDREGYALRFDASGPPNTTVELWAEKAGCGVEPFVYQTFELDASGQGGYEIVHEGSSNCGESLLGHWTAWLDDGVAQSNTVEANFANSLCEGALDCSLAQGYCPEDAPVPPLLGKDELFVLSDAERAIFDPPDPGWVEFGMAFEDYPLQRLWQAFDQGQYPEPLDPSAGPASWYELDGAGSQNHSLLWLGESALGYALAGDVDNFEVAAQNCLTVLELNATQGHMRHESVGQYVGFWQGGIASMALAGLYAPEGSSSGPELLEASRAWWRDHVAVLRALSLPDGQVALIGARLPGDVGEIDSWMSLSAAINLQLVDPRPHEQLHPTIAQFLTPEGEPLGVDSGVPVRWYRGRHVAERWVVLRAVQTGAILPVPEDHPAPPIVQSIHRWTEGGVTHTAVDGGVTGYRPARWQVSWAPGGVLTVVVGDPYGTPNGSKGPHLPPEPVVIPGGAELLLGG